MPFVSEKVKNSVLLKKSAYAGINEFAYILPQPISETQLPLAEKWNIEPCFLTEIFDNKASIIENFKVYKDDTWVVTFPKCGTTWTQEMVWMINNNLDYEKAKEIKLSKRFPYMDLSVIYPNLANFLDTITVAETSSRPRHIKSHLPAQLLPVALWTVKPKIIYVARNVKDVIVSFYHHNKNLHMGEANLEEFIDIFINDHVIYTPFHSHITSFWNMRNEENILFLTYEEMKENLPAVIKRTALFLEKSLTDDQIMKLADHLSLDSMKKNKAVNLEDELENIRQYVTHKDIDENFQFIRKGQNGAFKEEMTPEQIEKIDEWSREKSKNSDFNFSL